MPANLTQQYLKAEEEYRRAGTLEEELKCLQIMLQEIPKHKGTDHLQADLKSKISKIKKEIASEKSTGKKSRGLRIPRQGAGRAVLLGGPNSGKSQVVARLTNANPVVAPYPFSTTVPAPAMMPFEDVTVQMIDTPPITADYFDPSLHGLIRSADLALLVVDLGCDDGIEQCQDVLDRLLQTKTRLAARSSLDENDVGLSYTQTLAVPNKIDMPEVPDRLRMLHELCPLDFAEHVVSAEKGAGLESLREAGIFGFKSTVGRTDVSGVEELARSFDTVGWFARSPEDLTLLAPVLLTHPAYTAPSLPTQIRIGVTMTPYAANASAETRDAVSRAAEALRAAGHDVVAVELPAEFADCNAAHRVVVQTEIGRALAKEWREKRALFSAELASFIEAGQTLPAGAYEQAQARIAAWRTRFDTLMADFDALLCPSAAGEAPLGLDKTGDPVFNSMWSLLAAPCVSLPFARGPNGMPVGIQLVGGRGRDEALLALAQRATQQLGIQVHQP